MFARTGRTATLATLTGCAAALAVGGCHVDTGQLKHQARTYAVSSPVHTLVINDWVGDVHVTGGAGRVSVTERISYRHQLPATTHAVRAGPPTPTAGSISLRLPRGVALAVHASAPVGSTHVPVPQASHSAHSITARTQTGSVTIRPT